MSTRPYELLARFANDGSIAGVSVRTITTINGRDYESDPSPLSGVTDPAFVEFTEQFASAAVSERDSLRTLRDSLQSQVTTLTTERDQLTVSLASVTTERDSLVVDRDQLASDKVALTGHVEQLQSANASMAARIDELLSELDALNNPPINPRHVAPYVFLSLLTPQEIYALQTSADPMVVVGRAKLQTIITFVDLDNAETIALVEYMETAGLAAPGRAAQILAGEPPA